MKVRFRFFGPLTRRAGREREVEFEEGIELAEAVERVFRMLGLESIRLSGGESTSGYIRIYLNGKPAAPGTGLKEGDEVVLYPPIAGG